MFCTVYYYHNTLCEQTKASPLAPLKSSAVKSVRPVFQSNGFASWPLRSTALGRLRPAAQGRHLCAGVIPDTPPAAPTIRLNPLGIRRQDMVLRFALGASSALVLAGCQTPPPAPAPGASI